MMAKTLIRVCLALAAAIALSNVAYGTTGFLSAESIAEEVISTAPDPYVYDWRKIGLELELGYDYVDEYNNFDNDGAHIFLGMPIGAGGFVRGGIRRYWVYSTASSDAIGKTPFKQDALSTRYELAIEGNLNLVQGRGMSFFSPVIPDLEQALFATGGISYHHLNKGNMPSRDDKPEALPGQSKQKTDFALALGFRWHLYFPNRIGLFFNLAREFPLADTGNLRHWNHIGGGVTWAVFEDR